MVNKIIFKFSFENGWGDTFLSVFDIINCAEYMKKMYPMFNYVFIINDTKNLKTLERVLNLDFFKNFFYHFEIVNGTNLFLHSYGKTLYKEVEYKRIYSGRNQDIHNNINGIFDVFVPSKEYEIIENFNIPFTDFTFDNIDDRPKNFDVFNLDLIKKVDEFVENNFDQDFDSIYYRSLVPPNFDKITNFKEKLLTILDPKKKYFLCSNSHLVKQEFLKTNLNIKLFRDLTNHGINHIPNGQTSSFEDALFAVSELVILGKSKNVYYSGDMNWVSLFNWYAINIKKVKLINFTI